MKAVFKNFLPYLLAVIAAFAAAGIFIGLTGANVWKAYETILFTSFRTPNGFVQTLLKFVPLTLQALAFTIPLTAGKYNMGGEGQLIVGGIAATAVGILGAGLPPAVLIPLVIIMGMLAGAAWGFIAAWLLYKFNINEILSTMLLNFVSFQIIDLVATGPWRDPVAGHPTTVQLVKESWLPMIISNPPLNAGIILAIVAVAAVYIYTTRTTGGYELVATGANPRAAQVFGINTKKMFMFTLVLAGAIAGLSGAIEVSGVTHRLIVGLQHNFLILGVIIGLISKGNNLAVPFVAFFISVLEIGASAMQRTMNIPIEYVFIVEALVLIFVLLSDVIRRK